MGGSFGGLIMRHANRLSGWGSNDPRNADTKPRKKHPDVIAATKELHRIQDVYNEAKRNAMSNFQRGMSIHGGAMQRTGLITGDESVRDLIRISREL